MRKFLVFITISILMFITSCSSIKKEPMTFKRVNSQVESCVLADEGHYEVTLLLENGEKFLYHSKDDVTQIKEAREINMGYNRDKKATFLAVIKPSE